MKRILCLFLILLFILPIIAEARMEPDHIGKSKAVGTDNSVQIVRGDARIWAVSLINHDAIGAFLTLYDEYEPSLDEENIILEIEVATAGNSETIILEYPIEVSNGLYVWKSIASGTYLILYE